MHGDVREQRGRGSVAICLLDRLLRWLPAARSIQHGAPFTDSLLARALLQLKPQNVLLKTERRDRRGFVCKLADFGLSRCAHLFSNKTQRVCWSGRLPRFHS